MTSNTSCLQHQRWLGMSKTVVHQAKVWAIANLKESCMISITSNHQLPTCFQLAEGNCRHIHHQCPSFCGTSSGPLPADDKQTCLHTCVTYVKAHVLNEWPNAPQQILVTTIRHKVAMQLEYPQLPCNILHHHQW
jgi:hypothetical protein